VVKVFIPAALRTFSDGRDQVEVELDGGGSLRQLIERLNTQCPGIKERLMLEGDIHSGIAVFVNDEQISQGLISRVPEDASIRLLPALGGG
jgi:sulfur-carrier protein